MQKIIPTTVHGALDYMTAGVLFALPRLLRFSGGTARLFNIAAIGSVAYAMITRYEMGVVKKMPMPMHLTIDKISGATFALGPILFPRERADVKLLMMGIGLYELAVTMMSKSQTSYDHKGPRIVHDLVERTRELVSEPIWKR